MAAALAPLSWCACIGALLPDVAWLRNEFEIRRARATVGQVIDALPAAALVPYRITHSLITWGIVAPFAPWLALGAAVHLMLDWPTHDGRMRQEPLWPLPVRWPRALVFKPWRCSR